MPRLRRGKEKFFVGIGVRRTPIPTNRFLRAAVGGEGSNRLRKIVGQGGIMAAEPAKIPHPERWLAITFCDC